MNYTELKKAIRGYVENEFPDTTFNSVTFTSDEQLAVFVKQAEQRIFNAVQLPIFRKNMTGVFSTGNSYLSCPSDFLAPFSLTLIVPAPGRRHMLLNKDVEFIREAYPIPTDTARPRHYAIFGPTVVGGVITNDLSFLVGPTPDANYSAEIHYFYYPESITTAGTSWLGNNFDSVLLYGSLIEAYVFIKAGPESMAKIDAQYKEALALLKQLADGKDRTDTYRVVQTRYPVI